jgi:16S rRNA (guanine527-N7)-methyltransferase
MLLRPRVALAAANEVDQELPGSIAAQIEALAARFRLAEGASRPLEALVWLLAEDPLAPTTIRDPWRIVDDHLADSLVALDLHELQGAHQVVDLGSGAGIPGLPLAAALPNARFVLVESSGRKCAFIERAIADMDLDNVAVAQCRAESYADGLSRFDVATARAVAALDVVAEYAAPLLRVGGSLIAWRGRREPEAEAAADAAGEILGMEIAKTVAVQPYPAARNRHLTLMSKLKDTPREYPRRPGVAVKRPLGHSSAAAHAPGRPCPAPSSRAQASDRARR